MTQTVKEQTANKEATTNKQTADTSAVDSQSGNTGTPDAAEAANPAEEQEYYIGKRSVNHIF